MMLALKSGPQIAAKVGNPAGLLCQRIWYSVGKSGVLGITEYRQGRPLSDAYFLLFGLLIARCYTLVDEAENCRQFFLMNGLTSRVI